MKYVSWFHSFLFLLCGFTSVFFTIPTMAMPELNPYDLEEMNKLVEEYVNSLSPEEKAEFDRAVNEMTEMFDNMSPEEWDSLMNDMAIDQPMPESSPAQTPTTTPIIETPTLTTEQKKKVDNIVTMIDDIIRQSNVFFVQINSSVEIPGRIEKWAESGQIQNWQQSATWETLHSTLESFIQKLYKIQEKNITTNEYKYLNDLIADESAINNLIELQKNLNSSVPRLEISGLDIQKLTTQTKDTIKKIVGYYTESLYVTTIPKSLDAIFEKYEPTATKLKEAEEAQEKKALESLKRQRVPVTASTAGTSSETSNYSSNYGSSYDSYGSGYGGYDGGYGGYSGGYGNYDYGSSGYDYGNDSTSGSTSGSQSSSGGGSTGGGASLLDGSGTEAQQKTVPAGPPVEKNAYIKMLVTNISDAILEASKIINDNEKLLAIDTHINTKESDVSTDVAKSLFTLNKTIKKANTDLADLATRMKKVNKNTQAKYNKTLNELIEVPLATLKTFSEAIVKINDKKTINAAKRWAYFADDKALDEVKKAKGQGEELAATLKEQVKDRVSLEVLQEDQLKKLFVSLDDLKKNTAQKQETKVVSEEPVKAPQAPQPDPEATE